MAKRDTGEIGSPLGETYEISFGFNLTYLYLVVFVIPVVAFVICLSLTLLLNYRESTETHCNIDNYLPSISSAIAYQPQKYFWQFLIALQCSPRIFGALMYHKFYLTFPSTRPIFLLIYVLTFSDITENLSLLLLSTISSKEAHEYHVAGFVLFVIFSQLHMMLKLLVNVKICEDLGLSHNQRRTLEKGHLLRKKVWIVNMSSLLGACYFFYRHNAFCEAGVYTVFAICEYGLVLSNIAFHGTSYYDFNSSGLNVDIGTYQSGKRKCVMEH